MSRACGWAATFPLRAQARIRNAGRRVRCAMNAVEMTQDDAEDLGDTITAQLCERRR